MSRFKGMYWRQFGISVGLVALTLVLLGASFFSLTYSYMMTERRVELEEKAEIIAQMAERAYSGSSAGLGLWSEELRDLVDVAQQMSDINFLIWVPRYGSFVSTDASVANQQLTLPEAMGERLARGETYAGNSTLGIYSHPRFVVAIPARSTDSGEVLVGPVLAVMESAPMTEMWRAFLGIFLLTAITVLIIAFMATAAIVGQQINFMAYIILSSIQLGATVDYAILFTVKYKNYLGALPARQAAYKGLTESGVSILTSVAILAGCCLSVSLITSNRIVSEITMLIARGAIISGILVLVLLPALLIMFTGNQKLKGARIRKRQRKLFRKETDPDEGKEEGNAQQV